MPTDDHGTKAWREVECQFMESVFSNHAEASVQRREKDSIEEAGTIQRMKIKNSEGFYLLMHCFAHVYYISILKPISTRNMELNGCKTTNYVASAFGEEFALLTCTYKDTALSTKQHSKDSCYQEREQRKKEASHCARP